MLECYCWLDWGLKGSWIVKVLIESDLGVLKDGLVMVGNVINSSRDDEG